MRKEPIAELQQAYNIRRSQEFALRGGDTSDAAKIINHGAAINLGSALQVVSNFLDFVANHERPGQFTNSPDYVAARCVIERLCGQEEPVA